MIYHLFVSDYKDLPTDLYKPMFAPLDSSSEAVVNAMDQRVVLTIQLEPSQMRSVYRV